jgi:hypothetical protein
VRHLVDFFDKLKAELSIELPAVNTLFGAEYMARRDGQGAPTANRVVVAEHDETGEFGTFLPPIHNNRAPPDVGIRRQPVTIEIWGYDGTAPSDKAKQYLALEGLSQAVWRHTQAIIRAEYHVTPNGQIPGFYQIKRKAFPSPSERVHGKREVWSFWIDFMVRDIAPTTLEEPDLEITAELVE